MQFSDIPGHDDIKQRLRDMHSSGKIPHALLFEGSQGSGKLALARAFAAYINCSDPTPEGDSCGKCHACIQHNAFTHIDTHYIFPVIKGGNDNPLSDDYFEEWKEFQALSIFPDPERWSQLLNKGKTNTKPVIYVGESANIIRKLNITTHAAEYAVMIVWLPERMNEAAANKLLKLIEEPYPDTIFLLVSNNPEAILPTIYSRVQRIKVPKYNDETLAGWLSDTYALNDSDAMAVAHTAEGDAITAMQNLDAKSTRASYFELFKELMRQAYVRNVGLLREWSVKLAGFKRDSQVQFYRFSIRLLRENFIYNFGIPQLNYLDSEEEAFSRNFAKFITVNNVLKLVEVFEDAIRDISGNGNAKIINFDVAIKTILLIKNG